MPQVRAPGEVLKTELSAVVPINDNWSSIFVTLNQSNIMHDLICYTIAFLNTAVFFC